MCYGEIDIRFRIWQQIANGRTLDEVITTLVEGYFDSIKNFTPGKDTTPVVVMPIPPSYRNINPIENPDSPTNGTVRERMDFWRALNTKMTELARDTSIVIWDPFADISYPGPFMDISMIDYIMVHLGEKYNILLQIGLVKLLYKMGRIDISYYSNCVNYIFVPPKAIASQ